MNQTLAKIGAQLAQIWKQLGVSQKVTVAVATLAMLAGLSVLAFWSSRVEYSLLYGRLSDAEAAKVVAALDEAKVPYKAGTGGSIQVPADKVYATRMQMALKGIPRGDGVGFEIFDRPNFGISDFVQRANYVRALAGELGRTISQLDDVETARVSLALPERPLLIEKDKHPTASVFVRVRGNRPLPGNAINAIRFLVANAVEGLQIQHVSVVDNLGNVLSENGDSDSLAGQTASQLAARQNLEQYLSKKAESMLEKFLGPGQAIVRVAAEINYDTITRVEEKYDPEGRVIRKETKDQEDSDTTTTSANEAAGMSANLVTDTNAPSLKQGPVNTTRTKKTTGDTEYEVGRSTSNILQGAGGIKRLSAAVTVAARVEGEGAARKVVNRSPQELEKLLRVVQGALGVDTNRADQITLEEMPFNTDFATQVTQQMENQQRRDFWWELARTAVYPLLAVAVLVLFLRLIKSTPADTIPVGVPLGRLAANGNGNGNGHARGNGNGNGHQHDLLHPDRRYAAESGLLTVDALQQLIKENPTGMTQAIRNWLGKGGSNRS